MARLQKDGNRWVLYSSYDERLIPKTAGFRWDPDNKIWWTQDVAKARKLARFAVKAEDRTVLEAQVNEQKQAVEDSRAVSADINIPTPDGLTPYPYQVAGVRNMLMHDGRVIHNDLLGDEMGLGKTIQAILYINARPEVKKVLIVVPASLKLNWARELKKWLVNKDLTIGIANSKECPATDIIIINYEILTKKLSSIELNMAKKRGEEAARSESNPWKKKALLNPRNWKYRFPVLATEFDYIVVDECHRCKNRNARRTQACVGLNGKKLNWMTGTPLPNRPVEMWSIISHLDRETWWFTSPAGERIPTFKKFARKYCNAQDTRYGIDASGSSNEAELQEILRTTIMTRRLKKDVLKDLPAKVRQVVELESSKATDKLVAQEKAMFAKHEDVLNSLRLAIEIGKGSSNRADYEAAVTNLKYQAGLAFTEIAKARHDLAVAKVPQVLDFIDAALDIEGEEEEVAA